MTTSSVNTTMRFKNLYEAAKKAEAIKTKEDVLKWLATYNQYSKEDGNRHRLEEFEKNNYEIADDLSVTITPKGKFKLDSRFEDHDGGDTVLPIRFALCYGEFNLTGSSINSWTNLPAADLNTKIDLTGTDFESFEGAPDFSHFRKMVLNKADFENFKGLNCEHSDVFFAANMPNLTSLEGMPLAVSDLTIVGGPKLESLEGITAECETIVITGCDSLTSLKGIGRYIKKATKIKIDGCDKIESNILGLMKIKGLSVIEITDCVNADFVKAIQMIKMGMMHEADVPETQEALIEVGLGDYAKL